MTVMSINRIEIIRDLSVIFDNKQSFQSHIDKNIIY